MNAKEYVQYGEEWKNELMKLPKIQIIAFLRAARLEINEIEAKSKEEAEWVSVNVAMPGYDSNGEPRECLLRNDFNCEVLNGYFDENKWWIEKGSMAVGHYPIDSFDIDFKITHWNLAAFGKEGDMLAQIWIGCDCPNGETRQIKIAKLIDTVHDVVMDEPFCSICGKFVTTEKRNKDGDPMDS